MAKYAVECVDKETGNPYLVPVDAETPQQAVFEASKAHIAGRAIVVSQASTSPDQTAVLRQLQAMQLQQAYQHRSEHGFNPLRALTLLAVVLMIIVVVALAMSWG